MGKTKRLSSLDESFHKHYATIWGEVRWRDSLYPALARPTRHSALLNRALPEDAFEEILSKSSIASKCLESVWPSQHLGRIKHNLCMAGRLHLGSTEDHHEHLSLPQPQMVERPEVRLMSHWNMDAASVLAAGLLNVRSGDAVLDLCAAPGGKSIALAQDLFFRGEDASLADTATGAERSTMLCSNEADKTRFRRLSENLRAYLPETISVRCTNVDATSPHAHRELANAGGWDKILVDAPCSSERHIIHAHVKAQASNRIAPEMASWRPGSTKRLQETQLKLLMTALRLVKIHGQVLYATCSIEPGENDGVIDKARAQVDKEKKKKLISWDFKMGGLQSPGPDIGGFALSQALEQDWAESTEHGWIVLPDHPRGGRWGPLFFTMLTKVSTEG